MATFLDDIFMIWDHSFEDLQQFLKAINSFHPNIKFTYTISPSSVSFLDVTVSKDKLLNVVTDVFVKETNNHQYLDYSSCHPQKCKDGIPYSQGKRYRRIISDDHVFKESLKSLSDFFIDRGYPSKKLCSVFEHLSNLTQEEALKHNENENKYVLPFTVVYNPSLPSIGSTINKYWDILNLSKTPATKYIYENFKPIVAFKRPKNLSNYLVRSDFYANSGVIFKSQSCNSSRCTHCRNINHASTFTSSVTGETFDMRQNTNCKTNNVIYLITCKRCKAQYVGQTKQPVSKRMNSHRFDINNFSDPEFSTYVSSHFNSTNHTIQDFSFMPIDVKINSNDRLCRETFWIHKLKTFYPDGLNSKVLFNVS
jgi:hypothetical protein